MRFIEQPAPGALAAWVECFWRFDVERSGNVDHIIVPDGAVSLAVIALPSGERRTGITGPSTTAHRTTLVPGATYTGIRWRPGVAGSVLRGDVSAYRGVMGPIAQPPLALELLTKTVQQADGPLADVLAVAARAIVAVSAPLDEVVYRLAVQITEAEGRVAIDSLFAASAVSNRQLRRRFKSQCGVTAKELARLRRVRAACIELVIHRRPLIDTAAHAGFADQAHMSREFSSVFGRSAGAVDRYLAQIRHDALVV